MTMIATVMKNEVAAGHYAYRTSVVLNFASANFSYNNVEYNDEKLAAWQDGMWDLFVNGATVDIDGDGKVDAPEMIGYVPDFMARSYHYKTDKPLIYYRAASADYPEVFIASNIHRLWKTDADVYNTFPRINYTTYTGVKLERPITLAGINADNNGHYFQVAYNAQGLEIGKALYERIIKGGEAKLKDVEVLYLDADAKPIEVNGSVEMKAGETLQFVVVPDPFYVNDLEISVSKNLSLDGIFYVTATNKGEGEITIKRNGEVVKTVKIIVK